ncbi:hypothetical protein HMN09_00781200 [Mycena chlorophos]|uniref:Immunoreactive mannoprotein MP88 n=1 Tax=Mycena chlorophos TaxID=658473 RepID=A0A8H6STW7_MYCCL|nr:hypothetical protein HMN09_00781200 [Mycena chlorophos]
MATALFSLLWVLSTVHAQAAAPAPAFPPGVLATGTMGVTNPPAPTLGTTINQTSVARLLSLNSIEDFCLFAPPVPANISDTETEEVAWCTKARNNARVIPDGAITGVSFLKTAFYVQIMGTGNFTFINIPQGDWGGELDPHGQFGTGNPVGGNVTTNIVDGSDLNVAEWMQYISYDEFCIRACTNANATYSAAFMCWHELDVMGCEFVMPGTYNAPGTFETCDADVAYPPGWYPEGVDAAGSTSFSTFAQYFTGVYTGGDGQETGYTVGDLVTPTAPASIPSSSNCVTTSTISNGIALVSLGITTGSASATATASGTRSSGISAARHNASGGGYAAIALVGIVSGIAAVMALH